MGALATFAFMLLLAPLDDAKVVVEDGGDDRNHVGLDHAGPHRLRAPYTDIDDTNKRQVPFEHLQLVLVPALLEHTYQALDAAIDGEDIPDATGRRGEVCETVEGVDQGQCRGAVECPAVIEGGGDAHGGFVDIWDTEIDFSHGGNWRRALLTTPTTPHSVKRRRFR
jgi:hypothetical protein